MIIDKSSDSLFNEAMFEIIYLFFEHSPQTLDYLNDKIVCTLVCVQSFSHVHLFVIPWTVAHHAPLSVTFSRQEYWSVLPFPTPRDLPDPEIELASLRSPALADEF